MTLVLKWDNKERKGIAEPISLNYLLEEELQSSLQDGAIRELSVLADLEIEDSTKIKRNIRILDHPKNLIKVLRARLVIAQGLTGNNITTVPNQYRFTRTFLDGEALRIFDLKSTELRHETVANKYLAMNMVLPILSLNSISPSINAASATRWRSHAS